MRDRPMRGSRILLGQFLVSPPSGLGPFQDLWALFLRDDVALKRECGPHTISG